ncbi:M23 family metallopeptidase [Flavisolibacter nicotianae]|uniref:M23 family metallopeptidase n=1 Tax=Flavisolibacter nicotianae TaxID=2364882 RepID=UPI000EAFF13C|nr:M23 family metallopeptidase [Flavisolibacter nicotianae]
MKKLSLCLLFLSIALISFSFATNPARKSPTRALSRSLDFPVAGKRSNIKGFWGDSRDGGRRLHKGIDIYARKGTPVVAVCDGVIVNKDHTPIGGNTLWLKSASHPWTAYYAHLDRQLVREGQHVRKGQVIGTVGNTGNARHMPSHLHFGISPGSGWLNPMPYVKYSPKVTVAKMPAKKKAVAKNSRRAKRHSRR